MGIIFIGATVLYGAFIEVLAYGKIWGLSLGFDGIAIFRESFAGLFVIAILTTIANIVRVSIINKKKTYNKYHRYINL